MAKRSQKLSLTRNKRMKEDIFDKISAADAIAILKILAKEDMDLVRKIEQLAIEYLSGVDIDDIASQVYFVLDNIDVEELWDRSGSTRSGYVEPADMACEMFEEALEPFVEELKKYQELSMHAEAKNCCLGILKGIYQFEKKSTSEYKNWAVDAPREYFGWVLSEWKKGQRDAKDIIDVESSIKKNFADWS